MPSEDRELERQREIAGLLLSADVAAAVRDRQVRRTGDIDEELPVRVRGERWQRLLRFYAYRLRRVCRLRRPLEVLV